MLALKIFFEPHKVHLIYIYIIYIFLWNLDS